MNQTNFKIFPASLIGGQKVPLISGWKYDQNASNDPVRVKEWQTLFGQSLKFYGIPTGKGNDLLVLDIDIKTNGWDTINTKGLKLPDTLCQRTLNGGSHFVFKYPKDGKHYGNKVGFLPGLDIRGEGGWVAFYNWVDPSKPILEAPQWLLDLISKTETTAPKLSLVKLDSSISDGIFKQCLEAIRSAPPGESNNILNTESYRVGQLVASGAIERHIAETELFKAAKDRGKPDYESKATIKSGLDGGVKNPLTCPFAAEPPKLAFNIPELPKAPERWTPRAFTRKDLLNMSKLRKPQLFRDWSTQDIQITSADGGTGKTTLKLYEAICMALGDRFLGFECMCPGGKTLYITGEDTSEKLGAMLGAILKQMGLFDETPENDAKVDTILKSIIIKKDADLGVITKTREGLLVPSVAAMTSLTQAIEDFDPKMIVFDPISSFWVTEAGLNDMNKAVTKFMSQLAEKDICVEMVNHIGKASSQSKDMGMNAGRGGSGLPSNSRVSRVLRFVDATEYQDLTGEELPEKQGAIMCNVNKFSDGSPLLNKQFLIIRDGYLFSRKVLTPNKDKELQTKMTDIERVFTFIKETRMNDKYAGQKVIGGSLGLSKEKVARACEMLSFNGHLGEKIKLIENPDSTIREKCYVVTDLDGKEI